MGLLPKGGAEVSGRVNFEGRDLLREPDRVMRDLRGNRLAMIFQEPMTSLNPSYTVGDQIVEAIVRHRKVSRKEAEARGVEMLRRVRIPMPEARFHDYPHRLSGGMRQRVMIAMALACDPDLLIADEPTTALDVTIQAQILELMRKLREESGAAIILITHDLGVVAEVCDEVVVMYAGQVVERASVDDLFRFPEHPYTVGLLGALPRLERRRPRLAAIEGTVPNMTAPPRAAGSRRAARSASRNAPRCRRSKRSPAATSRAAGARRWRGWWRDPHAALSPLGLDLPPLRGGSGWGKPRQRLPPPCPDACCAERRWRAVPHPARPMAESALP